MSNNNPLSLPIFRQINEIVEELGLRAYVVGGYVRDIFLGRHSKDIDFVTIGSGIEVAEAVAATYAVNDVSDVVTWRLIECAVAVKNATPSVVVSVDRTTESDDHLLCAWELGHELSTYALELCCVNLTVCCSYIESLWLDAEYLLCILLVTEDNVAPVSELRHVHRSYIKIF